jgi:predicted transposase/invertase (TIGR01784 family)
MVKKGKASVSRDKVLIAASTMKAANDKLAAHHPQDKLIKCAFKNKAIAVDFFAVHLAGKGLGKQVLDNFKLSNNAHHLALKSTLFSDLVYYGKIEEQDYYLTIEHQSSRDKTLLGRLLEYTMALTSEHIVQGRPGMPIVLPICLYHDSDRHHRKNQIWGYSTRLADHFYSQDHANRSPLTYSFKLVDLTVVTDEEIGSHGHAAIVEWILKEASLPGDAFLQRVTEYLTHPYYSALGTNFD